VAFTSNGRSVLTGHDDGVVRLWSLDSGVSEKEFRGHSYYVDCVSVSRDDRFVLSGSADRTARMWDMATGQTRHVLSGHHGQVMSVTFSSDSRFCVTASWDGTVRAWDVRSGEQIALMRVDFLVNAAAVSHDNKFVVAGLNNGDVALWRLFGAVEQSTLVTLASPTWRTLLVDRDGDHGVYSNVVGFLLGAEAAGER
jgi:WD40 repeat protein